MVYGIWHNMENWLRPATRCEFSVFLVEDELDFMGVAIRNKNMLFCFLKTTF